MKAIKSIIKQLDQEAANKIRGLLSEDQTYADISTLIFDCYRSDLQFDHYPNLSLLEDKSIKIFERIIYLTTLRYFGLEDNSLKDVLTTSIFYSLYGNSQKDKSERISELEDFFHSMKRYGIEEEASPLLSELYYLSQGGQLEPVYRHLYNKYKELDKNIEKGIFHLQIINRLISQKAYLENPGGRKALILEFKKIRTLQNENPESKNLRVIYNIAQLILVVVAGQEQLLKDGNLNLEEVFFQTNNQIKQLAFGFNRFYLQNILDQLIAKQAINDDDFELAISIIEQSNRKGIEEAYNFDFPNTFFKEIRNQIVDYKFKVRTEKADLSKTLNEGVMKMKKAIGNTVVLPELFGRNPYSHLVN